MEKWPSRSPDRSRQAQRPIDAATPHRDTPGPVLVEQPSQLQGGGVRRDRQAGAILEALDASVGGKRVGGGPDAGL